MQMRSWRSSFLASLQSGKRRKDLRPGSLGARAGEDLISKSWNLLAGS
jgi:hypothetical protein